MRLDQIAKQVMANYQLEDIVNDYGYHPLTGERVSTLGTSGGGPYIRLAGRPTFDEARAAAIDGLWAAQTSVFITGAGHAEATSILREAGEL